MTRGEATKLSKPQELLLLELSRSVQSIYVADGYRPAAKLVALGLAGWAGNERLFATEDGRARAKLSQESWT